MDLEPPDAFFPELLALSELKDSSREISSHMVEMRRDGVNSSSEVEVLGEVQRIDIFEVGGDVELEQEIASEGVRLHVDLVLLQNMEPLLEVSLLEHLWGNRPLVESLRDVTESASHVPNVLD